MLSRAGGISVVQVPPVVEPAPQLPRRFRAEVGEAFTVLRAAAPGIAEGLSKAVLDEVVAEVLTEAELVIGDAGGIDCQAESEARCFLRCISQR